MSATLSTWTKYVITIRVCRSKQRLILTSVPPAPFCFQHSGIIGLKYSSCSGCLLSFSQMLVFTAHCFYRKKLSELDHMQRYFSRKISTPTFPSVSEQEGPAKHEEQRDTETDTSQLLLKSNHLVGQVNSIINGELFSMLKGSTSWV